MLRRDEQGHIVIASLTSSMEAMASMAGTMVVVTDGGRKLLRIKWGSSAAITAPRAYFIFWTDKLPVLRILRPYPSPLCRSRWEEERLVHPPLKASVVLVGDNQQQYSDADHNKNTEQQLRHQRNE
jgi:hypothetical protein